MFLSSGNDQKLFANFDTIGLKNKIMDGKDILIKINLSRTYMKNHPRTDVVLLRTVINYIYQNGGRCAIAEGSDGHLTENLVTSGLDDILVKYNPKVMDVDFEDCDEVLSYGERHYVPKSFLAYPVRIAIPATSKRPDMVYSNNIKLFVGAVPRKMYQLNDANVAKSAPRPKLHQDLSLSVANLFLAINAYAPFDFFINGGLAYNENTGEFYLPEIFIGNDALELDCHLFQTFFSDCEYPGYLDILETRYARDKV